MTAVKKHVRRYHLDVVAAYNREGLNLPLISGLDVSTIEEIMEHPYHWAHLTEKDTEDVLMEIYIARRRRMQ
jgi:hypothetical protein